jgi:hypothetical protein
LKDLIEKAQDTNVATQYREQAEKVSQQMSGNIKKQMTNGIDNASCVVVFITKRYVSKVASNEAEDNCQLEFNYACMRKSAIPRPSRWE